MEILIPNTEWAFLLIALGLALMFFEVFIPSGGVLGIVAAAVLGLGIYGLFLHGHAALGVFSIITSVILTVAMFYFMLRRLRFDTVQDSKEFTSVDASIEGLAGKQGTTETPLRPSGVARIEGNRVDVVAATGFIENTPVRVVETSGNRVVVNRIVVDPVAVDPVAVDPVAVDPVAVDPVAVDPVAVDPVAVNPDLLPNVPASEDG